MDLKDKQTSKNKHFHQALIHALIGIKVSFKEERNLRIQLLMTVLVVILGFLMGLKVTEWLWLCLSIFLVVIVEMINTAIENTVDLITGNQYHVLAKKAKDIAAGSVLLSTCFAVIVGLIIFLPKFLQLLGSF